jgi:predicted outer membrane repeat protein
MDGSYTLIANFSSDQRTLTVSSTKGGVVWEPGLGTFTYVDGTVVPLHAIPEPGYIWAGWSGSLSSPAAVESLTMTADFEVQANFTSLRCELYVDDNAPADPGPGDNTVSDPYENGSPEHPFDSIQEAIEVAGECAHVIVREGTYWEQINFLDKAITVTGFDPNGSQPGSYPIIDGAGVGPVVTFASCCPYTYDAGSALGCASTGPQPTLMGFVITGGGGANAYASAIACRNRSPLISNCVIVGNRSGQAHGGAIYCENSALRLFQCTISGNVAGDEGAAIFCIGCAPVLVNSIVWGNVPVQMAFDGTSTPQISYMDVQGGWPGAGNLDADPLFALAGYRALPVDLTQPVDPRTDDDTAWVPGDYHLVSKAGRWDAARQAWVTDSATSPCIDAGDPQSAVLDEPAPNGNRVNMGAYGGTSRASKSSEP